MFLLVAHPNVLKRVRQEIDEAMQVQGLSAPVPSYDECRRLPFVDACVREGLRFIASTFPRRRCSEVPLYLAGRYVPPGTSIATSACEIGRHKDVYGEDADEFAPERWLRAPVEKLRQWETLDVHWGFGVRKCLGKHIGLMALYKSTVLVRLRNSSLFEWLETDTHQMLQKFDLQLMEGTGIGLWSYPSTTVMQMAPRASSAM